MSRHWTPEEDAIIRTMTAADAQKLLPRRTEKAVCARRNKLGVVAQMRPRTKNPAPRKVIAVTEHLARGPETPAEHRFAQLMAAVKRYATEHQQRVDVGQILVTLANDWEAWT